MWARRQRGLARRWDKDSPSNRGRVDGVGSGRCSVVRAYVLIEMVAGQSRNLVNSLQEREGIRDVARVTGPYDVIAVLEGRDVDEISNTVTDEIHSQTGVVRTTTCVSLA